MLPIGAGGMGADRGGDFTEPRAELTLASPAVALRVAREEEERAAAAMSELQRMRREQIQSSHRSQ